MTQHKLLREDILPAIASNRKVQRLLNEFMDLLSEYENAETIPDQTKTTLLSTSLLATDTLDSDPPTTDQIPSALPEADQMPSYPLETDKMEPATEPADQIDSIAAHKARSTTPNVNEINLNLPATDQLHFAPQEKETAP